MQLADNLLSFSPYMKPFLILLFLSFFIEINLSAEYRILAFGDSNTWGWNPDKPGSRYSDTERWAGILQTELGDDYTVVCDGLVARRTNIDGLTVGLIDGTFLNGAKTLPAAIARNAPLDLVIVFLGTNDLQIGAERTAEEVVSALISLAEMTANAENLLYSTHAAPEVLIVVPPPFGSLADSPLKELFEVGSQESSRLWNAFQKRSVIFKFHLFDGTTLFPVGVGKDGIHLKEAGHRSLGKELAREIHRIQLK